MATKTKTPRCRDANGKLVIGSAEQEARDKTADFVMDWMASNCPSWTIDELLTHPFEAVDMATWVAKKLHRQFNADETHRICKAALNARKRGDLKRDRV